MKTIKQTLGSGMNNLTIEEERTGKYRIPTHTTEFFNRELHGGITVYYWGTYVKAGDFGTFSKIISKLQLTGEQVEMFESDKEMEEYCDKYGAMLQDIDEECTVSYQIEFIPKA